MIVKKKTGYILYIPQFMSKANNMHCIVLLSQKLGSSSHKLKKKRSVFFYANPCTSNNAERNRNTGLSQKHIMFLVSSMEYNTCGQELLGSDGASIDPEDREDSSKKKEPPKPPVVILPGKKPLTDDQRDDLEATLRSLMPDR